jgi:hypothetical protein
MTERARESHIVERWTPSSATPDELRARVAAALESAKLE